MSQDERLNKQFLLLDRLLTEQRQLWQFRPFALLDLPWRHSHPRLCRWLEQLQPLQVEAMEQDSDALTEQLAAFVAPAKTLAALCRLPQTPRSPPPQPLPAWLGNHVPGRKWQQVQAFEQAIDDPQLPLLEWCAGKGHLGRLLAFQRRQPVHSLELDARLCQQGQQLADRRGLEMRFTRADALAAEAASMVQQQQHAVALHACGELHLRLLVLAGERKTRALSISPCCYHLISGDQYRPLSEPARGSQLRLDRHDLRLPVQETVTAGQRIDRLRHREVHWRLSFDLLQRQVRGEDRYLNTPNLKKSLLGGEFADYCHWVAGQKSLQLPEQLDYDGFLAAGARRYRQVQRMELVRHLFRRPLELWLVLDRALYLQQQGYRVSVSEFCPRHLTPRNILIEARCLG